MAKQEQDHLVRNVGIVAGVFTVVLIVGIVTPELTRDKWESNNAVRVSAKLEEADRLQQSDPVAAHKVYDEVLRMPNSTKSRMNCFRRSSPTRKSPGRLWTGKSKTRFEQRRPRSNAERRKR